eukprot:Skav212094  [mRNA]  locus=scaffold4509:76709:78709:+ [translate_table: standard]
MAAHVVLPFELPTGPHWPWDEFIETFRRRLPWKALVRRWGRKHLLQEAMQQEVVRLHDAIHTELEDHSIQVLKHPPSAETVPVVGHSCPSCDRAFSTPQQLALHQWHVHDQIAQERRYLSSDVCPGCMKKCWSTRRLVQHLRYRPNHCWDRILANCRPVDEPASIAMPATFQHVKRLPSIRQLHGPLLPTSLQKNRALVLTDLWLHEQDGHALGAHLTPEVCRSQWRLLWHLLCESVQTCSGIDLEDRWLSLLMEHDAATDVHAAAVFWHWAHFESAWPAGGLRLRALRFADQLELAQYYRQTRVLRQRLEQLSETPPEDVEFAAPSRMPKPTADRRHPIPSCFADAAAWETQQREVSADCEVRLQPGLNSYCRIIMRLYSGHRRLGDFHAWAQDIVARLPGTYAIVSVDTSISDRMNILQPDVWASLLALARGGHLHGLLLGPPCETWSSARHEVIEDRPYGPRPLRHASSPWGILQLTLRELQQCRTGAILLLRGLWIALIVALRGGGVILEHPAAPSQEERPSIWRLGIMRLLLSLPDVFTLEMIEQWKLGARGVKPTSFLCANVALPTTVAECSLQHILRPSQALIGLHRGSFRTSSAKAYPTRLCRALALALRKDRPCSSSTTMSVERRELLHEFSQVSAALGGSIMPDYQPELEPCMKAR